VDRANQRFNNVTRLAPKLLSSAAQPSLAIEDGRQKRGSKFG
jgi:hypothetical protein